MNSTDRLSPQRGIALVLVLWVLSLLTVMALGMTIAQRTESSLTQNHSDGARMRALADAAIAYAVLNLTSLPFVAVVEESDLWTPNGAPRSWSFDGQELEIVVFDEQARLDLNQATPEQLAALVEFAMLEAAGYGDLASSGETSSDAVIDTEARDALIDAIIDWTDEDDLSQLNGAEDGDYEAEGYSYGAKDEPFQSVEELRQVMGMTRDLYQRLAPSLTLDNPRGRVNERFATAAVLAALRGLSLEEAQLQVEERDQPMLDDTQISAQGIERGGPLYRIRVSYLRGADVRRSMEALVLVSPGEEPPYRVQWRRFGLVEPASTSAEGHEAVN